MNIQRISKAGLLMGLGMITIVGCSKPVMTKALYLQSGRAQIMHPTDKESKQAGKVLSEIVSYQTKHDTIRKSKTEEKSADDTLKSVTLNAVSITAERPLIKSTTIRNGKINLSFLLSLPKTFMDERMQVVLRPQVYSGDSLISLPPVVLSGKTFLKEQEFQYAQVDKYQKSVVPKEQYDSVFFQSKKHRKFMRRLQDTYFASYQRDFRVQQSYERWRRIMEERYRLFNAKAEGDYDQSYHDKALAMLNKAYKDELKGIDTTSYRSNFEKKYTPEHKEAILKAKQRKLELRNTPLVYRDQVEFSLTFDSLISKTVTEKDSLEIAKHTYNFKAIAQNESKEKHQDIYKRFNLYFPRVENPILADTMRIGKDFLYLYSQDIEVTPNLARKLILRLDTRVMATDKSTWHQKGVDSLTFIVSGMNDLADKTLINRFDNDPEKKAEYQAGLDRLAVRDYRGAFNILRLMPDYNTAVAMAAMGHNQQALDLLVQLGISGKREYLRAILLIRLGNKEEAKKALEAACRKEPHLAFKAETDSELSTIMEDASYKQMILNIGEGVDE